jgi:hypothetical protein
MRCSSTCTSGRWNAAAWMRIAALPRPSFNRGPAVFRGKGVRLRSLRTIGTALNAGSWIGIDVRAGATSPG